VEGGGAQRDKMVLHAKQQNLCPIRHGLMFCVYRSSVETAIPSIVKELGKLIGNDATSRKESLVIAPGHLTALNYKGPNHTHTHAKTTEFNA
jgi:hypothetical protein